MSAVFTKLGGRNSSLSVVDSASFECDFCSDAGLKFGRSRSGG